MQLDDPLERIFIKSLKLGKSDMDTIALYKVIIMVRIELDKSKFIINELSNDRVRSYNFGGFALFFLNQVCQNFFFVPII
jgi:hypothetical protein